MIYWTWVQTAWTRFQGGPMGSKFLFLGGLDPPKTESRRSGSKSYISLERSCSTYAISQIFRMDNLPVYDQLPTYPTPTYFIVLLEQQRSRSSKPPDDQLDVLRTAVISRFELCSNDFGLHHPKLMFSAPLHNCSSNLHFYSRPFEAIQVQSCILPFGAVRNR